MSTGEEQLRDLQSQDTLTPRLIGLIDSAESVASGSLVSSSSDTLSPEQLIQKIQLVLGDANRASELEHIKQELSSRGIPVREAINEVGAEFRDGLTNEAVTLIADYCSIEGISQELKSVLIVKLREALISESVDIEALVAIRNISRVGSIQDGKAGVLAIVREHCPSVKQPIAVTSRNRAYLVALYSKKYEGSTLSAEHYSSIDRLCAWALRQPETMEFCRGIPRGQGVTYDELLAGVGGLPAVTFPETISRFKDLVDSDQSMSIADLELGIKGVFKVNKLLADATDTHGTANAVPPGILIRRLQGQDLNIFGAFDDYGQLLKGVLKDSDYFKRDLAQDLTGIDGFKKYLLEARRFDRSLGQSIRQVIDNLRAQGREKGNDAIKLILPVDLNGGHWIAMVVTIQNKEITGVKYSNSSPGYNQKPGRFEYTGQHRLSREQAATFASTLYEITGNRCAALLADGMRDVLPLQYFAQAVDVTYEYRAEQFGDIYCWDYTLVQMQRELGHGIRVSGHKADHYDLSYRRYTNGMTREQGPMQSSVELRAATGTLIDAWLGHDDTDSDTAIEITDCAEVANRYRQDFSQAILSAKAAWDKAHSENLQRAGQAAQKIVTPSASTNRVEAAQVARVEVARPQQESGFFSYFEKGLGYVISLPIRIPFSILKFFFDLGVDGMTFVIIKLKYWHSDVTVAPAPMPVPYTPAPDAKAVVGAGSGLQAAGTSTHTRTHMLQIGLSVGAADNVGRQEKVDPSAEDKTSTSTKQTSPR